MNLEETVHLLEALRNAGATHFKSPDFEVTLGHSSNVSFEQPEASLPQYEPIAPPAPNAEATARAQDVIDKLKLNDEELIDRLFPEGAGG